jgi:hypothetical protein
MLSKKVSGLLKMFLFNLVQFYLSEENPQQPILEKCIPYLHSEHYMPKKGTHINFPRNDISV